jgi:hypothetical protein
LQAFDQHLNMVLGDCEEIVTTHEIDQETDEEIVRVSDYHSFFSTDLTLIGRPPKDRLICCLFVVMLSYWSPLLSELRR